MKTVDSENRILYHLCEREKQDFLEENCSLFRLSYSSHQGIVVCLQQTEFLHQHLTIVCVCVCACARVRSVVSNSLQLHGQQPTRLLCPRDYLGIKSAPLATPALATSATRNTASNAQKTSIFFPTIYWFGRKVCQGFPIRCNRKT